ncbi:MAG TPA: ABC transporter permease [Clostridiales bacterium]|nr:ABC transporter permease [Clostridiales bacterium]
MNFVEMLRVIGINLAQNKFKVLLTSLGIIVGAVTIILVIAIGRGGEAEIAGQFGDLSAATVYVNTDYSKMFGGGMDITDYPRLDETHVRQMLEENPYLRKLMLLTNTAVEGTMNGETAYMNIGGVSPDYGEISSLAVAYGDDISQADMDAEARVAVLGDGLAEQYFGSAENALGETVKLSGQTFQIIGVLARKGDAIQSMNPDNTVFLPYTTTMKHLTGEYDIPQMIGLATDVAVVEKAIARMQSTLDYMLDDSGFFSATDAGSRMEAATSSATTMKMLLISVAAIVFVVGGIGIMNVLFVSVKERTREIGILKALGGSRRDIMLQFLLESVLISLFGGLIGALAGALVMPLMQYTDIPVLATPAGTVAALCFSVLTGALFGFYPAYKAAGLKPIDALNYE